MRLKNKRTGEIGELQVTEKHCAVAVGNGTASCGIEIYSSLAQLFKEWEDVTGKKPKRINEIDIILDAIGEYCSEHSYYSGDSGKIKTLNAVEDKLRAWKRLKDKGFRFTLTPGVGSLDITPGKFQIEINAEMPAKWFCCDAVHKDLETCFGGEE